MSYEDQLKKVPEPVKKAAEEFRKGITKPIDEPVCDAIFCGGIFTGPYRRGNDKNWSLPDNRRENDGPMGLWAPSLAKIAYDNGREFIDMYDAFCAHRVFEKPMPECPA